MYSKTLERVDVIKQIKESVEIERKAKENKSKNNK